MTRLAREQCVVVWVLCGQRHSGFQIARQYLCLLPNFISSNFGPGVPSGSKTRQNHAVWTIAAVDFVFAPRRRRLREFWDALPKNGVSPVSSLQCYYFVRSWHFRSQRKQRCVRSPPQVCAGHKAWKPLSIAKARRASGCRLHAGGPPGRGRRAIDTLPNMQHELIPSGFSALFAVGSVGP